MNNKKTIMKKPSTIIAAAAIIAVVASAVIVLGMQNKISQNALGQSYGSSNGGLAAAAANSTIASTQTNQLTKNSG